MDVRAYVRIILNIVIPIVTAYVVCVWGMKLLVYFMPFVIGWIVAAIANPPVRFLERKLKIVRRHSSVVLIVGVLALVIFGLYALVAWLFRELTGFVKDMPGIYGMIQNEVSLAYEKMSAMFHIFPEDVEDSFRTFMDRAGTYVGDFLQERAASAGGAVARSIPEVFVNTIVVFLSSYLFLAEHDRLLAAVKKRLPSQAIQYTTLLKKDAKRLIGGYFLAQFKIMFVIVLVLFAGFLLLQVHYCVFVAIGVGLLDFLPMFGTGTVLIPWAIVKVFTGEYAYALGLAALYILTQAIRQIIQPKIVGDSMGLPPLTTLFLLYIGFKIRGLAGMILAVPVGILLMKLYEYGMFDSFVKNVKLLVEELGKLRKE